MATLTPILSLTQIEQGQDGVALYNATVRVLEAVAKGVLHDRLTTPPGSVNPGEMFLIDGTGAAATPWENHDNELAIVLSGTSGSTATYHFFTRAKGMTFFVEDDDAIIYFDGSAWQNLHTGL